MHLEELLTLDSCRSKVEGVSKKRVINTVSDLIAQQLDDVESDEVFAALMGREQLGTTGLGKGIAIPHCRLAQCTKAIGALVSLDSPVDYDSLDGEPVDLVFALIVPEDGDDEHVKALGEIASLFLDEDLCFTLRHTFDDEDLYNVAIMT
ncbi:MAG: PTS sugar transporter subunit IIA [Gammaproteobacteria bacterium]|jgi:PTS system nitrogen regulatory IIA component|nr:PTS sugar transporter subunit IIA [Gammaproteobacteria bacterium]